MEDPDEIANYRLQPRSRTSSYATPSPNTSSVNLPPRGSANGSEMSERRETSSAYLQERLRERRTETLKIQKRRGSESTADSRSRITTPIETSSNGRFGDRRPTTSAAGSEKKTNMGVKGMEEAMDKLRKQNWDFKLEIFHRREKQEALEEKNEALEAELIKVKEKLAHSEKCYRELGDMNDEVMAQLEVHDQAVEEAVNIICELENKIDLLQKGESSAQLFDMDPTRGLRSSPPQLHPVQPEEKPKSESGKELKRIPSFLSDRSPSTEALRSIFRPSHRDSPDLPNLTEGDENAESEDSDGDERHNSPRLSVLSESSFMSVYGGDGEPSVFSAKQRKESGFESPVKARMDERSVKSHLKPSPGAFFPRLDRGKYLSLDNVASSPLRRIDDLKHRMEHALRNTKGLSVSKNESDMSKKPSASSANTQLYTDRYLHDHMPPTPDTMSTNTLRHQQNSYETLSKSSGSEDEKNSGTNHAHASKQFQPRSYVGEASDMLPQSHPSPPNSRPHTAGETEPNLRDGHSWDADCSQLSDGTDPWLASAQESGQRKSTMGVQPPRMFDFSSRDDWSPNKSQSGSRDLVFNNDYVSSPSSGRTRQLGLTSKFAMAAREESDTPRRENKDNEQSTKVEVKESKIGGISKPRIKPPVALKMDKRPPVSYSSASNNAISSPTTPSAGAPEPSVDRKSSLTKRSRLPGFLGGRSETLPNNSSEATEKPPASSPSTHVSQHSLPNPFHKKRNSFSDNLHASPTADTRRNPLLSPRSPRHPGPTNTSPATVDNHRRATGLRATSSSKRVDGRPSTAGSLDSRLPVPSSFTAKNSKFSSVSDYNNGGPKQQHSFGGDGAGDSREDDEDLFEKIPITEKLPITVKIAEQAVCPKCDIIRTNSDGGNADTKMGKIKGAVMKKFGRR